MNESDVVLEKSSISPPPKLSVSTRKNRREELSGRYLSASLSRYQAAAVLFFSSLWRSSLFVLIRASNPTLSRLVMYFTVTRVLGYAVFASNPSGQ